MLRKLVPWFACLALWPIGAAAADDHSASLPDGGSVTYLAPLGDVEKPPLLVFVAGSFWGLRPEQAPPIEGGFARPLRAEGVAVALVRHRPAPVARPRAYAEDVAAGLAWLWAEAGRLGFDPERVVLSGHGSGGQLAALVALDPEYLSAHELSPAQLNGVVPFSALYDLEKSAGAPPELMEYVAQAYPSGSERRAASPLRFVRGDAPPVIALAAGADIPGLVAAGNSFTEALRKAGHPSSEVFVAGSRDHYSILNMGDARNPAHDHVLAMLGAGERAAETRELWALRSYWRDPSLTTAGFWEHGDLAEKHQPRADLDAWLQRYFASGGRGGSGLVTEEWQAIPLQALLERLGPERTGSGRWLVVTNVRGERAVLDYPALQAYKPVVVVAIGEERNLFRIVDMYHTLRRNTWQQPEPERWLLARPLGAFLFFLEPPPAGLVPSTFGLFALSPESLRLSAEDPLAPVRQRASPELARLLIEQKACVSCHAFAGAGGRAGHLRGRDAELVGGFGEPLESYPAEAWRRYVYDQLSVAAEIGASPVVLAPEVQDLLYEGVVRSREQH